MPEVVLSRAAPAGRFGPRTVADLARTVGITPQGAALAVGHLRKIGWVTESQVDKSLTGGMTAAERKGTLAGLKIAADEGNASR